MKEKTVKRNVKMRGMKIPRFLIWILGRVHGWKGLITCDNGEWHSSYMNTKIKDYQSYSARLWSATAEKIQKSRRMIIHMLAELKEVDQQLTGIRQARINVESPNAQQLRANKRVNNSINALEERKKTIQQDLPELHEAINSAELEAEEQLLDCRRRAESILQTYIQGARKYLSEDAKINIPWDELSRAVYEKYQQELREYCKTNFKGGETYV